MSEYNHTSISFRECKSIFSFHIDISIQHKIDNLCIPLEINNNQFIYVSTFLLLLSNNNKIKSNRDSSGEPMDVFTDRSCDTSYFPLGLHVAITIVRVLRVVTIPALATDRRCCSIACELVG